jgi:hypothetical protein
MDHTCRRRVLIGALALASSGLLVWYGITLHRSQPARIARIGVLAHAVAPTVFTDGLRQGLAELGYMEGENIGVEWRFSGGDNSRPS